MMKLIELWLSLSFLIAVFCTLIKKYPIENVFINMSERNWFGKLQSILVFVLILLLTIF